MTIAITTETVEAEVILVWQEFLSKNSIDPEEDFIAAGGKTDQVSAMLVEVAHRLQLQAPDQARFLERPYLSRLVSLLMEPDHSPTCKQSPAVHLIRACKGHGMPAIVYIAPPQYEATGFRRVANLLPSGGAIYAVMQGRRIYDEADAYAPERTIAELVETIRANVPAGKPYILAGFCMGGTMAYMAAERLQHHGCSGLILLDAPSLGAPFPTPTMTFVKAARQYVADAYNSPAEDRLQDSPKRAMQRKVLWHGLRLSRKLLRSQWQHPRLVALRKKAFHQEVPFFYNMPRLKLPMLVIKAGSSATLNMRTSVDGWSTLLRGPLTMHVLPSDHASMFFRPNLPKLAEAIQQWTAQAGLNEAPRVVVERARPLGAVPVPQTS